MASYKLYTDAYYGISITPEDWPRLSTRADEELSAMERKYTITGTEEQRNKALCAIADELYSRETLISAMFPVGMDGSVGTTRVSIGSVSTSTDSISAESLGIDLSESGQERQIYKLVQKYMDVYRGTSRRCYW